VPLDLDRYSLEGVMLTWIYNAGAIVQKDQMIGELTVEKARLELLAPASGRLRILAPPETVIGRSHALGTVEPL
jgi:pyruvate/2-oxoglutarate dehydrogenase complex dihydrolipoamide acyltransferase (E2) component